MAISKSALLVLIFSLLLSFGLLSSAACANTRRPEHDPPEQYEKCQRRCVWETRGQREQEQCKQQCERQLKEHEERQHDRGLNPEDPRTKYEECQQECEQQEHRQRPQCQRKCQQKYEEQQREQRQDREPHRKFQECQQRCQEQQQGQKQQQQCQRQCREQYEELERDNQDHHSKRWSEEEEEEEEQEQEQGQQRNNPYFFPSRRSFQTRFREEEGRFKVLQRFDQKSRLLKGLNNFRLAMFEANPHTFILPHHCDAEAIYFVTNGRGIITFVNHENKKSYNVEAGTILRVPAGSTVYMVNQDNNEKLRIAVFAQPVNAPDKFVEFFPAGNRNPSSYIQVFSDKLLETVYNTPRETLERVFQGQGQREQGRPRRQQQGQGLFRRVEPEQIRSMSRQATSPRKSTERLAINLLSQSPRYSNQNGRFHEACPDEFKQLRDMDVAISACKINEGAIFVPHFNSRATYVVLVTEGNGHVEMACPHLSRQSRRSQSESEEEEEEDEEEETSGEYQKVKVQLSAGDVFVVPAGHPVTFVASRNQNLRTVGFGINAKNNERIFVAGKKNLFRQMDSEAKQIAFGAPTRLVDEVFNNPQESYFMSFSERRKRQDQDRKGNPLASFLDFTRLF